MYSHAPRLAALAAAGAILATACSGGTTPPAAAPSPADGATAVATGSNVTTTLAALSGIKAATVTFGSVTAAGEVKIAQSVNPPAGPKGLTLTGATYFDVTSTAKFDTATLCFEDPKVTAKSKLLHYTDGLWYDRTTTSTPPTICGEFPSFSLVALTQFADQFSIDGPSTVAAGSTLTIRATSKSCVTDDNLKAYLEQEWPGHIFQGRNLIQITGRGQSQYLRSCFLDPSGQLVGFADMFFDYAIPASMPAGQWKTVVCVFVCSGWGISGAEGLTYTAAVATPSPSPTPTEAATATPTATVAATATATKTPTPTVAATKTPSPTVAATKTPAPAATPSPTPSPTATPAPTPARTLAPSPPATGLYVYGRITDAATGEPIDKACITIGPPSACATTTDRNGNYYFDLLEGTPAGLSWTVSALRNTVDPKYTIKSQTVVVNGPTKVDLALNKQ